MWYPVRARLVLDTVGSGYLYWRIYRLWLLPVRWNYRQVRPGHERQARGPDGCRVWAMMTTLPPRTQLLQVSCFSGSIRGRGTCEYL